jgi:DNA-directed RNA polymerase subunit beta'
MYQRTIRKASNFNAIAISVASPDEIELWSHGEVTKPETINYRTQKPETDGLFCERIFGPTKNWECFCGKYKRIRYQGVVCEKCGVEVTRSIVRRDRMGHINLAVPVTHIWFLRSTPSRIGLFLDLPVKTIEQVVYFAAYIIIEIDEKLKKEAQKQLDEEFENYQKRIISEYDEKIKNLHAKKLTKEIREKEVNKIETEHVKKMEELKKSHDEATADLDGLNVGKVLTELEYREMNMKFGHIFRAGTGAEAIREIISRINLTEELKFLLKERKKASGQKQKKIIKRIRLFGSLLKANIRPEWMIISVLPVIPPDLRPMVQLDGGRFAASDLNDLYRRVINRNNRLKKLIAIGAPEVICRNEKRMLQEAVDTLLNNSARSGKAVFTAGDRRKLRSLSDMLKGKQGRFRQNLLGKRVDYSGRSVIVVGPKLQLHQCGLPKEMALKLFKPFVIGELIRQEYTHNVKGAERLIQAGKKEVWDILEKTTQGRYVLLNRAPTLHRLGIQAFQPILIEGKAIQIHPLVCAAFNADFDGDQMAVHLPLSTAAQKECREYMLSTQNLLKPSAGEPIITPTQDMVLGCYFLTKMYEKDGHKGEGMVFATDSEAINAYRGGIVDLQTKIKARVAGKIIETTIGRIIFNNFIPEKLKFINKTVRKSDLSNLISSAYDLYGREITAKLADDLKRIGFKFATKSGLTVSVFDLHIPAEKPGIIEKSNEVVKKINNQFWKGLITEEERYIHTVRIWAQTKSDVSNIMIKNFEKNKENDIYYMIDSGARGNWGQITQLCGMKGLVANPGGETIELPIKANLKEGFTILEYFIATHGGRKGKSDTALKTAEAGYLTRRLVDAVQDVIIRDEVCNSEIKHIITREESEKIGEAFENRIYGRALAEKILNPRTGEMLAEEGEEVDNVLAEKIQDLQINEVKVRSIMTCNVENGICQKCYGRDLGTNKTVDVGTPVGIIAAQSIGEPGTQLTMRTFHMGGVAEASDITQGLTRVEELFEARPPKTPCLISDISGTVSEITMIPKGGSQIRIISDGKSFEKYIVPSSFELTIKVGERLSEKQVIAKSIVDKDTIKVKVDGIVEKISVDGVIVKHLKDQERVYITSVNEMLKVERGDYVNVAQPLTAGHFNLHDLMRLSDVYTVQKYIMNEVQQIYASQGQTINDKHIEIIVKKMFSKVRIIDSGDSDFLPGEIVDIIRFQRINEKFEKEKKKIVYGERLLLGLTRVSLLTDSWLAAASFQETIRVLVEAACTKKVDNLRGLKENVIIGKLIQAGELYKNNYYRKIKEFKKSVTV